MPEEERDLGIVDLIDENKAIESYDDITGFAQHLIDISAVYTAQEIQYYYEKPWKWEDERAEWKKDQLHELEKRREKIRSRKY